MLQQEQRERGASSLVYFKATDASCDSIRFRQDCEPLGHHYLVRLIRNALPRAFSSMRCVSHPATCRAILPLRINTDWCTNVCLHVFLNGTCMIAGRGQFIQGRWSASVRIQVQLSAFVVCEQMHRDPAKLAQLTLSSTAAHASSITLTHSFGSCGQCISVGES